MKFISCLPEINCYVHLALHTETKFKRDDRKDFPFGQRDPRGGGLIYETDGDARRLA